MEHRRPNLDHIVVHVSHQGRPVEFALNKFLNQQGLVATIRVSSHYDYDGMRKHLLDTVGLPAIEPLVFNGTQKVRSQNELERLIIGIQTGITILPSLEGLALPALFLHTELPASTAGNHASCEVNAVDGTSRVGSPPKLGPSTDNHSARSQPVEHQDTGCGPQSFAFRREPGRADHLEPPAERRKIQPQLLAWVGPGRQQERKAAYFRQAGLSSYDILHHECDSDCSCDDREFSFQRERTYPGHSIQVNRLLKRAANVRGRYPAARRSTRRTAGAVVPLNDPFDDEVLPPYGESDEDYDSETWEEIQAEENSGQRQIAKKLSPQEVDAILDEVICGYETKWWKDKPTLQRKELPTWQKLHCGSTRQNTSDLSKELQMLGGRIATMRCEVATSHPWSAKDELVRAAANLEPSVRDRLKTKWKLKLANQNQRPEGAAAPPPQHRRKASRNLRDGVGTDGEEDLSSSSDEEATSARRRQQITGKTLLQEALERHDPTMRATLLGELEGAAADSVWQGLILPALELGSLPTSQGSSDSRNAYVAKHLIRLFDMYTRGEVLPVHIYKTMHESDKTRIRGNENQFTGFVHVLSSLRHALTPASPSTHPISEHRQTDGLQTNTGPLPSLRDQSDRLPKVRGELHGSRKRPHPNNVIELSSDDDIEDRPMDSIERDEAVDDEISSEREMDLPATGAKNSVAPEDSDEVHRQQIEDIGGRFANRSISPEDWKSLCRMFQCREDIEDHKPVGFKMTLSGYQLHAIWWLITQFPLRGVPGGCLGDEMGLGKTVEVLSVFVLFALIKKSYVEVRDYWSSGKMIDKRVHLPKDQKNLADAVCPSQHLVPSGLLCPCVRSGETYFIATELPSLPTICFAPPTAIHGWRREFESLIDRKHPVMRKIRMSILHSDFKGDETYYHSNRRVQATMAEPTELYINRSGQPGCLLRGRDGLSNWLLLASSSGAPALLAAYDDLQVVYPGGRPDKGREDMMFTTNCLAASFVFFDEAHNYRGTLSNPTQPYAFLKQITRKSWEHTVAISVSGSISAGGPCQLVNTVDHILRVKGEHEDGTPQIGGVARAAQLEEKKSDWNYLLQNHHIISKPKIRTEVEKRKTSMAELMRRLVPHVLMARRNQDEFRGRTIGDDGREMVIDHVRCDMIDGPGRDAFCTLTAQVQTYVSRAFDERHNAWMTRGKKGAEPTRRSVELEYFGGQSDGVTAMRLGKAGSRAWTQLLRANVYPEVARLYLDGSVTERDLEHNSVNRHGDEACLLAATDAGRESLLRKLAESPFWPHRAQLVSQSPKFAKLCEYVEEMLAYRKRQPDVDDPGPADGTNVRHMVVFSDSAVSSFITFMLLCEKYPSVQVMIINGRTRGVATPGVPGYGRREMIDNLMSDCTKESRNKIIISTYRICGTALNMQRANYCVLLEPARNAKEEEQAAARRGQRMRPVIVRLHDERNLPETLRRARHQNQGDMETWQAQGIRWDEFVC